MEAARIAQAFMTIAFLEKGLIVIRKSDIPALSKSPSSSVGVIESSIDFRKAVPVDSGIVSIILFTVSLSASPLRSIIKAIPPDARTRSISFMAVGLSPQWWREPKLTTMYMELSGKGRFETPPVMSLMLSVSPPCLFATVRVSIEISSP